MAVVLSAAACSGGSDADGGGESPEAQAALKTCIEYFGKDNVESVRSGLTGIRAWGRPAAVTRDRLLEEARVWQADSDDLKRTSYRPCQVTGDGKYGDVNVVGTVMWSRLTTDYVSTGAAASDWRKVSDDVYVRVQSVLEGRPLVMTCTVPGTAPGQGRQLPLEVRVLAKGVEGADGTLEGRLLSAFARNARAIVGCKEAVAIPDSLQP